MREEEALRSGLVASVAVEHALYSFDRLFDYSVPDSYADRICAGMRVIVPFGRGNKKHVAVVFSLENKEYDDKVKAVTGVIDDGVVLSDEMLYLAGWLKENTFCTYFDAVRTMLPTGLSVNIDEHYTLAEKLPNVPLSEEEQGFMTTLLMAKTRRELNFLLGDEEQELVRKSLLEKGYIELVETAKRRTADEKEQLVRLAENYAEAEKYGALTPKQRRIVETLEETGAAAVKEICYICNVTAVVVKNLAKNGIAEIFTNDVSRSVSKDAEATEKLSDIVFSSLQQKVFDGLCAEMEDDKPHCALLHGVTGSGKTSVFIKLIEKTTNEGKTAIMLVPEISLTPQMMNKFQRLFGNKVAIIHSGLTLRQRADEYKRIKSGDARIVIGTRSAVFAPVDNIGIIVIDEEGEHTYKSEKSPRYHARNVAKQRCFRHNAFLLLASATPSLDSYHNAKSGRYSLYEMNERYSKAQLPEVYLVDMKLEAEEGNRGNFSTVLLNEIAENLQRGEQSMLLLNRRGYHTYINCIRCGAVMECPNCSIPLTYHKANGTLVCHYCGYHADMPKKCGKCGSEYLYSSGTGTQRIEDEISQYFPKARILRMDADTTMSKTSYEKKFGSFGRGEYDIMVGTQMIAKGLDFENVTLVGVLLIDRSLYAGDYLGYEKTFSLVTQVVGRSGRGTKKGRAYIQTFSPDHYVLQLAAQQNYKEFYNQENEVRKALIFPPYCDICLVSFSSLSESHCTAGAQRFLEIFTKKMKTAGDMPLVLLGPTKSGIGRIGGRYRSKLIIKCKSTKQFRALLNDTIIAAYADKTFSDVLFSVDFNGDIF